ncbi:MAG: glycosyltransferase family 4 protein [Saprospiraceae bacterium]
MTLIIEATNIRAGGGLTHISEMLTNADEYTKKCFSRVIVIGSRKCLDKLKDLNWVEGYHHPYFEKNVFFRIYWLYIKFPRYISTIKGKYIVFNPGGAYVGAIHPFVTMSQNMLVFDAQERNRYPLFSVQRFRLQILSWLQSISISKAKGVIFISEHAKDYISRQLSIDIKSSTIIPHGISKRFFHLPKNQLSIDYYSANNPFNLLYVSIIDVYKHQWVLAEAVLQLKESGFPVKLTLIGPKYEGAFKKLEKILLDPRNSDQIIDYKGEVPFDEIDQSYKNADGFVFSSTCENMPNIVIEAMSAGLPILSSSFPPMPEFLKEAAFYFDPLSVENTKKMIVEFMQNGDLRSVKVQKSFEMAQQYNWSQTASLTFQYLKEIAELEAK